MKKLLSALLISFIIFFGFKAVAIESENGLESQNGVGCFDYYKFQSVQVNVGPNKSSFAAGEDVDFSGKIINENRYPVFNGYVYVRIAEKNPGYIHEGHNIVDEFIAFGPIAVDASSSKPVSFSWKIPENIKTGEYTANYFFSVNKRLELSGLTFTNEITGGFSSFSVLSIKMGNVSLVKNSTKVNNEKYNHIGNWPLINMGEKAVVTQVIQNTLKQDVETEISYNLYYWDSLDPKDLISTKKESLTLKAGESKTLTYEIPKVELSVYYLQIVAKNENGTKSIVNIRITSDIAKPRINYFGLDNFPIQKGATTTLYSCFHNTSNISASGTTVLIAKDKVGREISRVEYSGVIPSAISAQKTEFIVNSKLDYIKLEQKIYDDQKNLLDTQEIIYDVSLIKKLEIKAEPVNPVVVYALLGLIVFGFLLFFVKPVRKNKNLCLVISLVIISLAGALLVLFMQARPVKAQSKLGFGFQKSQNGVESHNFSFGFREEGNKYNTAFSGTADYTYEIITTAPSSAVSAGSKFYFLASTTGEFFGSGGSLGSPFFGTIYTYEPKLVNWKTEKEAFESGEIKFQFSIDGAKWVPFQETTAFVGKCVKNYANASPTDCIGGSNGEIVAKGNYVGSSFRAPDSRYGYRKQIDIPQLGTPVSSNSNVISCSSGGCEAVGPGIATITASIGPSEAILGYSYPFAFRLFNSNKTGFIDSIHFSGFTASWDFEVLPNDALSPVVSGCNQNTYLYGDWGSCISGIQTRPYSVVTPCPAATNTPQNTQSCCIDQYTYSWSVCNEGDVESIGTPVKSLDCPTDTSSLPVQKIRLCPGYTTIEKETSCVPTQGTSTKIYVNKQTQWEVVLPGSLSLSASDIINTKWSGTGISTDTTTSNNLLDKLYTTLGIKNISATTTARKDGNIYTITCSTSTNVIFGGGGVIEI